MMYSGFLSNKIFFALNRDTFLNHHKHIYMERKDFQSIKSYEVDIKYNTNNILSTLGEFFEREVLINTNRIKKNQLESFSLINGNCKLIDSKHIVSTGSFVDSCGMASHTNSASVVQTAFLEFFERQSLIFNFLTESIGYKLDIHLCDDLLYYDTYIKNFVDNTFYFDISLDAEIHVVLSLAIGSHNKALGLGTDLDLKNAINKSQKEVLQNFAVACSKYNHNNLGFEFASDNKKDLYHSYFESLSIDEVENNYSYLKKSPTKLVTTSKEASKPFNFNNFLQKIHITYGIDPHIVFINSKRPIPHLKVIKIIDFNWFPHMRPELYSKNIFKYIELKTGKKLKTTIKIIPFP